MSSKSIVTKLTSCVMDTIKSHKMIDKDDAVIVALSGGADSVCMLDIMCNLRDELGIKIGAAHLNHMIRGAEAERDEAYAAEICTKLQIPFYAERVNVPELAKKECISEETAGRKARYDFFERLRLMYGYTKIATAHNMNDKAETVLMRIIRGTGIDGLSAIKYKREDGVIRPILDINRKDIESYCKERELVYCTDSTNNDVDYTRNRIRAELIPMIEEKFNPSVVEALCTLSDNAFEDSEFINGYAERLYNRINHPMNKEKPMILDIETLKLLDNSIFSRIIRLTSKKVMGTDYKLERIHVENIRDLMEKQTGSEINLPSDLYVRVKYGWLEFEKGMSYKDSEDFSYDIEVNDKDTVNEYGILFKIVNTGAKLEKNQMIVDYDMLEGTKLTIRNRRIGDRIVLFKDGRSRKLKDYWIDKKLPRSKRGSIPLLCSNDKVVAIIGDRVAETYKIKENTMRGLVVTYDSNENR